MEHIPHVEASTPQILTTHTYTVLPTCEPISATPSSDIVFRRESTKKVKLSRKSLRHSIRKNVFEFFTRRSQAADNEMDMAKWLHDDSEVYRLSELDAYNDTAKSIDNGWPELSAVQDPSELWGDLSRNLIVDSSYNPADLSFPKAFFSPVVPMEPSRGGSLNNSPISPCSSGINAVSNVNSSPGNLTFDGTVSPSDSLTSQESIAQNDQYWSHPFLNEPFNSSDRVSGMAPDTEASDAMLPDPNISCGNFAPDLRRDDVSACLPPTVSDPQELYELYGSEPPSRPRVQPREMYWAGRNRSILGIWESVGPSRWQHRPQLQIRPSLPQDVDSVSQPESSRHRDDTAVPQHCPEMVLKRMNRTTKKVPSSRSARPKQQGTFEKIQCKHCMQLFSGKYARGNSTRHAKNKHGSNSELMCECGKPFKRSDALLKHKREQHQYEG